MGYYNKPGKNGRVKCSDHLVREADLKLAIIEDIRTLASNLSNATIYKKLENQLQKINWQNEKQISSVESEFDKLKTRKKKARDKNLDAMTDFGVQRIKTAPRRIFVLQGVDSRDFAPTN
ncbi:hypothetical protein HNR77_003263 [Paenibacillus sp. JGP012]|uniref:hypothetical protein n=1 Tax=Paenibacillus sp. JGP012 TaxID=2735914 RepID=UPI001620454B|nr:hypothetical protein [Paenibacillus sp. JGP012]MBB6022167.1 hypothetical protein [Paenibacillus sp. JGP012]